MRRLAYTPRPAWPGGGRAAFRPATLRDHIPAVTDAPILTRPAADIAEPLALYIH